MTQKTATQDPQPPAQETKAVSQIHTVLGVLPSGKAVPLLSFNYAQNDGGKAVFPMSGHQIVEHLTALENDGKRGVSIYGVSIRLKAFISFRASVTD